MLYIANKYRHQSLYSRVHPVPKSILVLLSLVVISYLHDIVSFIVLLCIVGLFLIYSHIPVSHFMAFLRISAPFWLLPTILQVITNSLSAGCILFTRVFLSLSVLFLYISTTSLDELVYALSRARVSPLLIDLVVLTVYSLLVLLDGFSTMKTCLRARGFTGGSSLLDRKAMRTVYNAIRMTLLKSGSKSRSIRLALSSRLYKAGSLNTAMLNSFAAGKYETRLTAFAVMAVLPALILSLMIQIL